MEPVVKQLTCPNCKKPVNVRTWPEGQVHTFHCPNCKQIVKAPT